MPQIKKITTDFIIDVEKEPVWVDGIWECGNRRFVDQNKDRYVLIIPPETKPVVTPPQARLVFTSEERVFLKANITSEDPDPVLKDFFEELSDPQLTEVDFNLSSVQSAYQYALNFVAPHMIPAYTEEVVATRYAQILTGTPL